MDPLWPHIERNKKLNEKRGETAGNIVAELLTVLEQLEYFRGQGRFEKCYGNCVKRHNNLRTLGKIRGWQSGLWLAI